MMWHGLLRARSSPTSTKKKIMFLIFNIIFLYNVLYFYKYYNIIYCSFFILYHIKFKYFDQIYYYWRALDRRERRREGGCSWANGGAERRLAECTDAAILPPPPIIRFLLWATFANLFWVLILPEEAPSQLRFKSHLGQPSSFHCEK